MDHLQTVIRALEKMQEFSIALYVEIVDYTKAFDSLQKECLLEALNRQGIRNTCTGLLSNIYENSYAKVRTDKDKPSNYRQELNRETQFY